MDEDKIKVELEIDTSNAESGIDKLKNKVSSLFDNLKRKTSIDTGLDSKKIENTISTIKKELEKLQDTKIKFGDYMDTSEVDGKIQKLTQSLNYWQDILKDTNSASKETGNIFQRIFNFMSKTDSEVRGVADETEDIEEDVEEVEEGVKRTTKQAGFLHKIFARIGQSMSKQIFTSIASLLNPINNVKKVLSYMTDVVTPRLGATFKNIGENILQYFATSPLFENLIHGAIKLIYLLQQIFNVFARIFGFRQIDLFDTSMETAKKLQKMQQQMVAGFDEINDIGGGNQQDQLDATPLGIGELISDEEKKKLDDIANKFTNIGNIIKEIIEFVKKWWKELFIVAGIIAGIVIAIKLFTAPKGLDALKEGLGGLADKAGTALEIIAILGGLALVFQALSDLVLSFKDNSEALGSVIAVLATVFGGIIILMIAVKALGPGLVAGLAPFGVLVLELSILLGVIALTLPTILDALGKFINTVAPPLSLILTTIFTGIKDIIKALGDVLIPLVKEFGNIFTKIFDGVSKVVDTFGKTFVLILNTIDKTIANIFNHIIKFINDLGPSINNLTDNLISAFNKVFNALTRGFETVVNNGVTAINWLLKPIRNLGNDVLDLIGIKGFKFTEISKMPALAKLATGTNYVPNDQLAYIHKGEAVIPKKFNDREYFGTGNEDTNALLEILIDKVDNIEFNPYTTVKDVGKGAVEYIKQTNRQLGRSVI